METLRDDAAAAAASDPGGLGGFGVLSAGFGFGSNGPSTELNQLTHDLLNADSARPEPWAAAAMYWESRGEPLRALSYADRALRLDDRHAPSHVIKGQVGSSFFFPFFFC